MPAPRRHGRIEPRLAPLAERGRSGCDRGDGAGRGSADILETVTFGERENSIGIDEPAGYAAFHHEIAIFGWLLCHDIFPLLSIAV